MVMRIMMVMSVVENIGDGHGGGDGVTVDDVEDK